MGRPALLETFQPEAHSEADLRPEDTGHWHLGFEAGYEKALQEIRAEQALLTGQIAQSLRDQAFGYHEARTHFLDLLRPLFVQLAETFAPGLARDSFVPLVSERLHALAEQLLERPIALRVSPDLGPVLRGICREIDAIPIEVIEDDGLTDLQAVMGNGSSETIVDLQSVLEEVRTILGAMTSRTEYSNHG